MIGIFEWFKHNRAVEIVTSYVKEFSNSSFFAKIIVGGIVWAVCLIPVWLYLFTLWILSPISFWKGFAVTVLFMVGIGWLQIFGLIFGIVLTGFLIVEDNF